MSDNDHEDSTAQIRVVIVDDSAEVRYLLAATLETDGRFTVVGEADRAKIGVAVVDHTQPDLVLVDLRLGYRNGISLLRELRHRHPHVALALVTGSSTELAEPSAFEAGADSVHSKESSITTMADELAASVAARAAVVSV